MYDSHPHASLKANTKCRSYAREWHDLQWRPPCTHIGMICTKLNFYLHRVCECTPTRIKRLDEGVALSLDWLPVLRSLIAIQKLAWGKKKWPLVALCILVAGYFVCKGSSVKMRMFLNLYSKQIFQNHALTPLIHTSKIFCMTAASCCSPIYNVHLKPFPSDRSTVHQGLCQKCLVAKVKNISPHFSSGASRVVLRALQGL